jgi:hypothetical protein
MPESTLLEVVYKVGALTTLTVATCVVFYLVMFGPKSARGKSEKS